MKYFTQGISTLTQSNIPALYPAWVSGNTYTYEDDGVLTSASVVEHNNYYWRSASIDNTEEPMASSKKWVYAMGSREDSVSNRLALLDNKTSTKTVIQDEDLIVEFERNSITTIALGNFESKQVTIEHLDETLTVMPQYTQIFNYKPVTGIISWYTYWFDERLFESSREQLITIPAIGKYIRITFEQSARGQVAVGFLYGGKPIFTGQTVDDVQYSFDSYKTTILGEIETTAPTTNMTFYTQAPKESTVFIKNRIKELKSGTIALFIIDDTESTLYNNLIILGELQSAPLTIDSFNEHITSWTVYENP